MSKKALRSIGTLTLAFLLLTTLAFATSGLSAWCIVPALNGSANSEDTGVKETTGSSAYLYSATVGGGYEVDSFIALTGPFIYSIIENYIMSILGIPQYSMTTSFYISRLAPGYAKVSDLFAGPAILALFVVTFFLINIMKAHRGSTRCLNIV